MKNYPDWSCRPFHIHTLAHRAHAYRSLVLLVQILALPLVSSVTLGESLPPGTSDFSGETGITLLTSQYCCED